MVQNLKSLRTKFAPPENQKPITQSIKIIQRLQRISRAKKTWADDACTTQKLMSTATYSNFIYESTNYVLHENGMLNDVSTLVSSHII